jgi:tRNA threonylcarbamoyladenosine biosynthesis protein TsaB
VILVALDTASPSTVAGVLRADGRIVEARDDPPEGSRGEHAARALPLLERALAEAEVAWRDVERIAVGIGPGGFTGLRIGIATARALAQANGLPLVPVGSLAALAAGADGAVAAVLDARRGEVFAAVYESGRELVAPAALAPDVLATTSASNDKVLPDATVSRWFPASPSRNSSVAVLSVVVLRRTYSEAWASPAVANRPAAWAI